MLTPDVIDRVKKADPDRYRAAMFADKDVRESLLVFYAFHSELAKIPELVSEPMLGAIRYQWWRDCVDEIYTEKPVRRHEVATPLAKVLRTSDVPRFWVDALINGRERDIDPRPFEDMSAAKQYCQDTSGQLMQIALNLTGEESGHVMLLGQAWGLTGLARGYRFYHDTMLKAVSFSDISQAAREDYDIVRSAITKMSTKAMPALGYGA
ncbi:MAG: squalene/phytoene synthase family protein, partial [Litorimonas sp.]